MSSPSKTSGMFGRFNPRRLFSGLGAFAHDMRPTDGDGPSCDLCLNEHRQQHAHSIESTDSTSSDYRTASLPPDEADVEIPLETRDSIECLLETLQTQHGGKVPRWARRAARMVNQRNTDDEDEDNEQQLWTPKYAGSEQNQSRPHESLVELGRPPWDVRVVNDNGSKVAKLRRLFEH